MRWATHQIFIIKGFKVTIYVSIKRGWTCVASSHHRCAYALTESWLCFSMVIKLVLLRVISKLNLYCFRKASTKSFYFLILVLSSLIYHLKTNLVRLSWKNKLAFCHYRSLQPPCCSMTGDGCLGILVWYTWWSLEL